MILYIHYLRYTFESSGILSGLLLHDASMDVWICLQFQPPWPSAVWPNQAETCWDMLRHGAPLHGSAMWNAWLRLDLKKGVEVSTVRSQKMSHVFFPFWTESVNFNFIEVPSVSYRSRHQRRHMAYWSDAGPDEKLSKMQRGCLKFVNRHGGVEHGRVNHIWVWLKNVGHHVHPMIHHTSLVFVLVCCNFL